MPRHRLLERQVNKFLGPNAEIPPDWQRLLDAVQDAYEQFDCDRRLTERAMLLSSEEIEATQKTAEAAAQKLQSTTEALKTSESFLHSLVENIPVIVYRKDKAGRLTFANQHYCDRYGKPLADILGKTDFELSPPELARNNWADNLTVMETRQALEKIEVQIRPNGEESWIQIIKVPVIGDTGEVIGTQGMYWDVTERKRAEEALRKSEERFREMAESIRDVFWVATPDAQQVLYVSPAYESIWGSSVESLYKSSRGWLETITSEDRPRVLAALDELGRGIEYRIEYRIIRPSGDIRWIKDRGFPVRNSSGKIERILGVGTDITESKELEEQLRQAQKMEAIGLLAGGVAHDFNNLLTVITGYSSLLLDAEVRAEDMPDALRQIFAAGERAANLTRQLLVFSRKHRLHIQTLDLNNVIDEMSKMLRRLIGEDITLELNLTPHTPLIRADGGMIEQVLMNLIVNARDAMPRGGQVTVKTELTTLSAADAKQYPETRIGDFICLSVHDSGIGIPPDILPRVFEPFFTTKEPGRGTGLGLATVFGIVKQHEGWITVESQVDIGTLFKVFLPTAPVGIAAAEPSQPTTKISGGEETILLVEDEVSVREFATAVLERYGYRVLQAASGLDALEVWKWHAPRIALLLTDMVMPGNLTGLDLAKILLAEKPTLKVICTSGYSGDGMERTSTPSEEIQFMHKPYQPRILAKTLRNALDRGNRP